MLGRQILVFLAIVFCLWGCATIYNPATGQEEFIFITTPTEVSIGNMLAERIAQEYKISNDSRKTERVREIGDKIAAVSDRKDLKYQFFVIEDDELNAFTTPGGYVYVNTGVIEKSSDDELACVLGHEVGHIAARHIAKKLQAQIGYDILMNIAASKSGVSELQKAASVTFNLVMLGYSREDELLADKLGAKYAYKSGYDPYAMITFLKKIKETVDSDLGFIFLRSHPYTDQRIKALERDIPRVMGQAAKKPSDSIGSRVQARTEEASVRSLQAPKEKESAEITDKKKPRPLKVMCPKCKRIFSGRFKYCPYDGAELK